MRCPEVALFSDFCFSERRRFLNQKSSEIRGHSFFHMILFVAYPRLHMRFFTRDKMHFFFFPYKSVLGCWRGLKLPQIEETSKTKVVCTSYHRSTRLCQIGVCSFRLRNNNMGWVAYESLKKTRSQCEQQIVLMCSDAMLLMTSSRHFSVGGWVGG